MSICLLFRQFVKERTYLKAVSPKTLVFYNQAWAAFQKSHTGETVTKSDLVNFIVMMKDSGVKPVSINTYSRALNAFFNWAFLEGHLPERLVIQKLKEEQVIVRPLDDSILKAIISYKPKPFGQKRLHTVLLTLIDTGIRINEALTLERSGVDFNNLLLTVRGKGNKDRIIPFSVELRKHLYKFLASHQFNLAFPTKYGGKVGYWNLVRDYEAMCERLKITKDGCFHRFRHTFALNYVRNGGGLFHLQKQLGHATLAMTRRYTELETKDLQEMHLKTSVLARLR
jgi:integrase/recombinase XerD